MQYESRPMSKALTNLRQCRCRGAAMRVLGLKCTGLHKDNWGVLSVAGHKHATQFPDPNRTVAHWGLSGWRLGPDTAYVAISTAWLA
jgi:hypothetical protein